MFISGFDWRLYGTGKVREMPTDQEAEIYVNRFGRQLGDSLHFRKKELAYYAALGDKTPGLGGRPVRKHWHFLLACPDNLYLISFGKQLWEASNGWITDQSSCTTSACAVAAFNTTSRATFIAGSQFSGKGFGNLRPKTRARSTCE
jgi:hypothetical protein